MTSNSQTCFTPAELLENIPGSCQHCVADYVSQILFCPWTSFKNFVFPTSPQISHMKSHRVNKDTGQLNTMSPKTLHMTATELLMYDRRHCHAGRTCTPWPHHSNFQKVVRETIQCTYLQLLFPKRRLSWLFLLHWQHTTLHLCII